MNLWVLLIVWAFLVLMVGGFTNKDKEYRHGVYKTMAIALAILIVLGWIVNLQ